MVDLHEGLEKFILPCLEDVFARAVRLQSGDHFLLVEMGPLELDIERRFKVHALMLWLQDNMLPGMRELTPGIRSLQVHYDSQQLSVDKLLAHIEQGFQQLADTEQLSVPARVVHLYPVDRPHDDRRSRSHRRTARRLA